MARRFVWHRWLNTTGAAVMVTSGALVESDIVMSFCLTAVQSPAWTGLVLCKGLYDLRLVKQFLTLCSPISHTARNRLAMGKQKLS